MTVTARPHPPRRRPRAAAAFGAGTLAVTMILGGVVGTAAAGTTKLADVTVGTTPIGVAITPDGTRAYVTNNGSKSVSVLDNTTTPPTKLADVTVGINPVGVAITPDGTRAYVTNYSSSSNSVSVLDTTTTPPTKLTPDVTVGTTPFGVAITPDGTRAYVTNQGSNSVSVLDTTTPPTKLTPDVTVGNSPRAVAITPDGTRAYVTNYSSNYVSVLAIGKDAPTLAGVPPAGVVGAPYSHTFATTGNPTPTVTVTTGTLPTGLTLSGVGVLTGTPTATGSFPFTVTAANGIGTPATLDITLTVTAAPAAPMFTDSAAVQLDGVVGTELTREFTATGNPIPTVSVVDPALLPAGMTFTNGVLSGAPTTPGIYPFTLKAVSTTAPDATLEVTVTVVAAPAAPAFVDAGPVTVNGIAGTALTHAFAVTGNPAPTLTATGLPTGLTLGDTGVLTGTPSVAGSFPFTITADNGVGTPATLTVTLDVAAAPAAPMFTDAGPVTLNAVTGAVLTREFTVTGNPTPTVTVVDPAKLPTAMTFTDGVLSGTPTAAGTYTFVLQAANGVDPDLTLTVTVKVTDAPGTPGGNLFGSLEQIFGFGS
ncbi:putative Ig domain-containing protein [Rhodococcus qingshengii]|uniref:YncE family protein n=1 Tax=Rhodococcus qingshengii TaxID=334542 RepID=UPI003650532D